MLSGLLTRINSQDATKAFATANPQFAHNINNCSNMENEDWNRIQRLAGNRTCVDCSASNPDWASVSYGTLMCMECAGVHRSLGTHISFVRSIRMDNWTPDQVKRMEYGNAECNAYFRKHLIQVSPSAVAQNRSLGIRSKYFDQPAALFYKNHVLPARIENKPIPTYPPPKETETDGTKAGAFDKSRIQGIGTQPTQMENRTSLGTRLVVVGVVIVVGALAVKQCVLF